MPLSYALTTAPTANLVTLEDQKAQMYVDHNDDDDYIDVLIGLASRVIEVESQVYLGSQTWTLSIDAFPTAEGGLIQLLRSPVQSITSVKYTDLDGNEQTLASSGYTLDEVTKPARLVPSYGNAWPSARSEINAVRVEFVCGYASLALLNQERPHLTHAVKLLAAQYYENREDAIDIKLNEIPNGVAKLISLAGIHTYT